MTKIPPRMRAERPPHSHRAKRGNFIKQIDDSVARPIQTPRWFDTADSRAGPRYKTQRTSS